MARTYKEWEDDAKKSGLYDTFSERDRETIKEDVDYGDRILNNKIGYNSATNDETRQYYKNDTEKLRNAKGYYGSDDGTKAYDLEGTQANLELIKKFSEQNGQKKSNYSNIVDAMLMNMMGSKFSYDASSDPKYKLAQEYAEQAMKNQMAESAILSGGYGNSYAANVGQNAYTDYMDSAVERLEDRAYSRWSDDQSRRAQQIQYLMSLDDRDYNRAIDDRNYAYQVSRDNYTDALQRVSMTGVVSDEDSAVLGIPTGTLTAEEKARMFSQYTTIAGMFGYVPDGAADALGVAAGTKTLSASSNDQQQALNIITVLAQSGMIDKITNDMYAQAGVTREYAEGLAKIYKKQNSTKETNSVYYDDVAEKFYKLKTVEDINELLSSEVQLYEATGGRKGISPEESDYLLSTIDLDSLGTSEKQGYDALFSAAALSGNPQSFISSNYKKYGFSSSSGLYNDYKNWSSEKINAYNSMTVPNNAPSVNGTGTKYGETKEAFFKAAKNSENPEKYIKNHYSEFGFSSQKEATEAYSKWFEKQK